MLKRAAVLGMLAPLALAGLSSGAAAAGWGPLVTLMLGNLPVPFDGGWRRGESWHRGPHYPRHYAGFYGDGGVYRAPYYPGYYGAGYSGYGGRGSSWGCGGYGNYDGYSGYVGYAGYGYDDNGW